MPSERPSQRTFSSTPTPRAYELDDLPAAPPPAYNPRAAPRFSGMLRASNTPLSRMVDPPCYFAAESDPAPPATGITENARSKADFAREEKVRKLFERHSLSGVAWEDFQAVTRLDSRWKRRVAIDMLKRGGSVSDVNYPAWTAARQRRLRNLVLWCIMVMCGIFPIVRVATAGSSEDGSPGKSPATTPSAVSTATGVSNQSYATDPMWERAPYTGVSERWTTLYEPPTTTAALSDNVPRTLVTVTASPTGRISS